MPDTTETAPSGGNELDFVMGQLGVSAEAPAEAPPAGPSGDEELAAAVSQAEKGLAEPAKEAPAAEKPVEKPAEDPIKAADTAKPVENGENKAQKRRRVLDLDGEYAKARRMQNEATAKLRQAEQMAAKMQADLEQLQQQAAIVAQMRENPLQAAAQLAQMAGRDPQEAIHDLIARQAQGGLPGPNEFERLVGNLRAEMEAKVAAIHQQSETAKLESEKAFLAQRLREVMELPSTAVETNGSKRFRCLAVMAEKLPDKYTNEVAESIIWAKNNAPHLLSSPERLAAELEKAAMNEFLLMQAGLADTGQPAPAAAAAETVGQQATTPGKGISNTDAASGSSRGASAAPTMQGQDIESWARSQLGLR